MTQPGESDRTGAFEGSEDLDRLEWAVKLGLITGILAWLWSVRPGRRR